MTSHDQKSSNIAQRRAEPTRKKNCHTYPRCLYDQRLDPPFHSQDQSPDPSPSHHQTWMGSPYRGSEFQKPCQKPCWTVKKCKNHPQHSAPAGWWKWIIASYLQETAGKMTGCQYQSARWKHQHGTRLERNWNEIFRKYAWSPTWSFFSKNWGHGDSTCCEASKRKLCCWNVDLFWTTDSCTSRDSCSSICRHSSDTVTGGAEHSWCLRNFRTRRC